MATARQIESAPVIPEGKAHSLQNARKHGLCSAIHLATESSEELEQLVDRLTKRFPSDDVLDELLIEEMAAAKWRQVRIWNIEKALMNDKMQRQQPALTQEWGEIDHATRNGLAFDSLSSKSTTIYNLDHYEARQGR